MEEFFKICFHHWPLLCSVFVIALIVAGFTYKITTKYHHWTSKISLSEDECKKIEGHIMPRFTKIDSNIDGLRGSFDNLLVYLKSKDGKLDTQLMKAHSPFQLTETGLDILEKIGGKKFVDDNLQYLISKMEEKEFKSGLDVENYTNTVLLNEISSDAYTPIKNYMFQHPIYKNGTLEITLNIPTVNSVIGIYLRNKYFEKHPELNT